MPQSAFINKDLPKHEFNPDKAKKILDEAGWAPGSDGIRAKNGVRLEVVNSTTAGNHVREQAQQFLQQSWREIGVAMTITNLPPAVMWGDFWMQSKFETAFAGIAFLTGPDPDARPSDQTNPSRAGRAEHLPVQEAEIDDLLAKGARLCAMTSGWRSTKRCRRSSARIWSSCRCLPFQRWAGTRRG